MKRLTLILLILSAVMALDSYAQTNCYVNVSSQVAKCSAGSITSDTWSGGCRNIVCTSGSNSFKVKACDKPGGPSSTYFELYRTLTSGTRFDFCLGTTCLKTSDFAKSGTYTACPKSSSTNTTNASSSLAIVEIDNYVSKDHNLLVKCLTNFTPAKFVWDFGDGTVVEKNESTIFNDTNPFSAEYHKQFLPYYYHTYSRNGTYIVKCTASNGTKTASGSRLINIRTEASPEEIPIPSDWTDYFNPYVFRPVIKNINGSTFKIGGYSIGVPRDSNNEGQIGNLFYYTPFYSHYTSSHENVLTFTFPEPGNYTFYPDVGANDERLTPELYTYNFPRRGCSNARTICQGASGTITVNVPNLGTRNKFGIETKKINDLTYNITCGSYASDAGAQSRIDFGDVSQWGLIHGNQWVSHTYPREGVFDITCYQKVESGMDKIYEYAINATNSSSGQTTNNTSSNASTCYNSVKTIPTTCTSTITQNTASGNCRTILCGSGSNTIKVLSCDKPDTGAKQYFEMYRQSYSGIPPKVCIGDTCIQSEGYKKSPNYPICS